MKAAYIRVVVVTKDQIKASKAPINIDAHQQDPRIELKKLSDAKTKDWKDNIVNRRRRQLEEREERLAREEKERVIQDEEFEKIKQAERQAIVDRAKKILFAQKDVIKNVHHEFLQDLVLQERQKQIEYKRRREEIKKQMEIELQQQAVQPSFYNGSKQVDQAEASHRQNEQEVIQYQAQQRLEKLKRRAEEHQRALEEAATVRRNVAEFQESQRKLEERRVQEQQQRKQELEEARLRQHERKVQEKAQRAKDLEDILKTADESDKFRQMLHQTELKYRKELQEITAQLVLEQSELIKNQNKKKNDWIEQRVYEKQLFEKKKEQDSLKKKQKETEDMIAFFEQLRIKKERDANETKEKNRQIVEQTKVTLQKLKEEEIQAKKARIHKAKELESEYGAIIKEKQKIKEQQQRQGDDEIDRERHYELEEQKQILDYIEQQLQADWMKSNPYKRNARDYYQAATRDHLFS